MSALAPYWKSLLAFLSLVVTNVAVVLVQSGEPWPANLKGWGTLGITTLLGTWLVYQKANTPSTE